MNKITAKGHYKRAAIFTILIICLGVGLSRYQATADRVFVINYTHSLPNWAFIVDRKQTPRIGDLVFFTPPENRFYGGRPFVKKIAGGAGDRVTIIDRQLFINNRHLCTLLEVARDGSVLQPGPTGEIPKGHYFLYSNHERSYDSRYNDIGWISAKRIVGVVIQTIL